MNPSMISTLTAMNGLIKKLDVIANNMANANTDGYKRKDVSFEDILTTRMRQPETFRQPGRMTPLGMVQGWGSRAGDVQIDMGQGTFRSTGNQLDVAIEGDAFFEIGSEQTDNNGNRVLRAAWTRNGSFHLSMIPGDAGNSYLTTADGKLVIGKNNQPIVIPNQHRVIINPDGRITAVKEGDPLGQRVEVGQLKLVRVLRPQVLQEIGDHLFALPDNLRNVNGNDILQVIDMAADPNQRPSIVIRQGFLEDSNVDLTKEMTELINVQRAFQLNSRALQSGEMMMNLANNLRG
ncbi:flagellar hook-basal body protein [Ferviditalea candida]|uniref:Flagellar hook-basal body protein n=1 Tax=Ferviditalea candida TaxID=3108399 RepID=A0ABU5ZJ57_9BACL|nr:flagellar hook-basal body protein [Paenibacillaceae bacterium T2]